MTTYRTHGRMIVSTGRCCLQIAISADCPELIRTLKHLPRDDKKPDDCSRHAPDHLPDSLRYMLSRLPPNETTFRSGRIDQLYPRRRA
jgi:hypothetical protein